MTRGALMARGAAGGMLELAVVPTFATKWLLPRLPDFQARHPGIEIHLTARARPFLFEGTPFDAAIHVGVSAWPGTEGLLLMSERLLPVCSPRLLGRRKRFTREDWQRHTLLQQSTRPDAWRQWFGARGLEVEGDLAGPRLELFSMHVEAALHGLGLALVPSIVVQDELARGLLVPLADEALASGRNYFLIHPAGRGESATLQAFRSWLQVRAQDPDTQP